MILHFWQQNLQSFLFGMLQYKSSPDPGQKKKSLNNPYFFDAKIIINCQPLHNVICMYINREISESVLTMKQCPPFGSERQADIKLSGRPLNISSQFISCQWLLQRWWLRATFWAFQVCVASALEITCSLAGSVHITPAPRACSKKFPYETSASSGTGSSMDVSCLVSLGRNTPCFIVSMHKKLAKCMASSVIRFSFHRATVIYEAYFHVVTRKCFHLMIGQCTFLYQTCLKTFCCFKYTFSHEICCFNHILF